MSGVEVENFIFKATLDAREATRDGKRLETQLRTLEDAEKTLAKQSEQLKTEMIRLAREELKGGEVAKQASKKRKAGALLLREEKMETDRLRKAISELRMEQAKEERQARQTARAHDQLARSTTRAEQAASREALRSSQIVAREAARAEAIRERSMRNSARTSAANARAIDRAQGRTSNADEKIRRNGAREISSARAINARETAIADLDKQLMELQSLSGSQRALGRFKNRGGVSGSLVRGWAGSESPYKHDGKNYRNSQGKIVDHNTVMNEATARHGKTALRNAPGAALGIVGAAAGGLVAGAGVVGGIASAGGNYEKLRAGLTTSLGGDERAGEKGFDQIKQFAKETPYAVEEVTRAVTTLKVRGLEPTVEAALEAMRTYGDVAGAMGKDLPTVVEAVSDAANGELERLKEAFNVTGHKAGDELKLTFNGVTTTVKNSKEEITNYLKQIGKANFAGGMARQAKTLEGSWSNLGDAVMNFADEIYRGGLGDALKEVFGDMTEGVSGSESLAQSIGEKLGDAVRSTYEFFKELLGPVDELPAKFQAVWEKGEQFVSVALSIVDIGVKLADTIGLDNVALIALTTAAAMALGPLGAIAVAATAIGYAIGSALADGNAGLTMIEDTMARMRHTAHVQDMKEKQEFLDKHFEELDATIKDREAAKAAGERVARAELRALGVHTKAEAEALPEEEKLRITRMRSQAESGFAKATLGGDTSIEARKARANGFAEEREHRADQEVYNRLSKTKKNKRSVAEEKELKEVSARLGVKVPTGGKKTKEHLTAAEQEQKHRIDEAVKNEELRAADEARLTGRGSEALALAKTAGEKTRTRLEGMAKSGQSLPHEIDDAFGRVAGYENQAGAPPPPVVMKQFDIDIKLEMPLQVTGFDGSPRDFSAQAIVHINEGLETQVYPAMRRELESEILR